MHALGYYYCMWHLAFCLDFLFPCYCCSPTATLLYITGLPPSQPATLWAAYIFLLSRRVVNHKDSATIYARRGTSYRSRPPASVDRLLCQRANDQEHGRKHTWPIQPASPAPQQRAPSAQPRTTICALQQGRHVTGPRTGAGKRPIFAHARSLARSALFTGPWPTARHSQLIDGWSDRLSSACRATTQCLQTWETNHPNKDIRMCLVSGPELSQHLISDCAAISTTTTPHTKRSSRGGHSADV